MLRVIAAAVLALLVLLAGIPGAEAATSKRQKGKKLEETQIVFASSVRWGDFGQAWQLVDPKVRKEQPLSELEFERFRQVQVTGYREGPNVGLPDGSVGRMVEIGVVNRHTQAERVVRWREQWRWDEEAKRWWVSGMPDFWDGQ
jgi:hypothetical protein